MKCLGERYESGGPLVVTLCLGLSGLLYSTDSPAPPPPNIIPSLNTLSLMVLAALLGVWGVLMVGRTKA